MSNGTLSKYFETVAVKKLSEVEVNPKKSNQHEFNGTKELKQVFNQQEKTSYDAKFLWLEDENAALANDATVTWYDSRENQPHRSAEYRLYFTENDAVKAAKPGDTVFIAKRTDGTYLFVFTPGNSTIENQLYWLFGLQSTPAKEGQYEVSKISEKEHVIDFATRFILDELGIEVEEPENDELDKLLAKFAGAFPTMAQFSEFARNSMRGKYDAVADPDKTLVALMEWEEKLFRRLERHIISDKMKEGFDAKTGDLVEGFLTFSLSVHQRRKSRAGSAFEKHIAYILQENKIHFSTGKGVYTEKKSKPDFLFPCVELYHNASFPPELLSMLAAKTTCKDRWRQVVAEAARIDPRHLLTLQPGISEAQTNEMISHKVQLVVPKDIFPTYKSSQQAWLMNMKDFITMLDDKQKTARSKGFTIA